MEITKSKTETEKETKLKEAEKVYETDKVLIIIPKTHSASMLYGSGTKWCTSGKSCRYWEDYTKRGTRFYYIIDKIKKKKYAVAMYLSGEKEVYDEVDNQISYNKLKKELGF